MRATYLSSWIAIAACAQISAADLPPGFYPLGTLPNSSSTAHGISGSGTHVVGVIGYPFTGSHGADLLRWSAAGGLENLGRTTSISNTEGLAVNDDGSVIVGKTGGSFPRGGFRWTAGGGFELLPGTEEAWGVSADGSVVVGVTSENLAFRWTAQTGVVSMGDLPGGSTKSWATDVNADGRVIVGWGYGGVGSEQAFIWTEQTGMVGLGDLAGGPFQSNANAVSANGLVAVGGGHSAQSGNAREAFRWAEDTGMVGLGFLPGSLSSEAFDVSADGDVVVGISGRAFMWTIDSGMRSLEGLAHDLDPDAFAGWTLTRATGVSDDGRIITGWGTNPTGIREGWVIVVPSPSVLAGAVIFLAFANRRRRLT